MSKDHSHCFLILLAYFSLSNPIAGSFISEIKDGNYFTSSFFSINLGFSFRDLEVPLGVYCSVIGTLDSLNDLIEFFIERASYERS